jgi:hypothetical protein
LFFAENIWDATRLVWPTPRMETRYTEKSFRFILNITVACTLLYIEYIDVLVSTHVNGKELYDIIFNNYIESNLDWRVKKLVIYILYQNIKRKLYIFKCWNLKKYEITALAQLYILCTYNLKFLKSFWTNLLEVYQMIMNLGFMYVKRNCHFLVSRICNEKTWLILISLV